jgi:sugar phosphate isomerase/epimerase
VDALEHILDAVKSPAIQVYYDVGNMQKEGEDYAAAIRRLGRERICETHAKDYGDLYGRGSTDFVQVRDALHDIGYSGWMHIEGVKVPNGIEQDIGHDLGYLRSVFS